ncbi:MAG: hypothetical protein R2697_09700 [Ilumatobacteraceae bacterium]
MGLRLRRRAPVARRRAPGGVGPLLLGAPAPEFGEGGTIPFMAMLGQRASPGRSSRPVCSAPTATPTVRTSSLHLPTGRKVTAAVAVVLHAAAQRR